MRAVNLLPSESSIRGPRQQAQPVAIAAAASALVAVLAIAGGNLIESSRLGHAQLALNQAHRQLASAPLPPSTPTVAPPPAAVEAQLQPRLAAVSETLQSRIAWDRILREFSLVVPPDIQISTLSLTSGAASASAATSSSTSSSSSTNGLSLEGLTYSYDSVARLVARMALVPDLTNVQLASTATDNGVVTFTISASVKGAAVPVSPTTNTAPPATTTTTSSTS
ncbi:MAG: PilN domain-containing protein [Actinobacteria bacterium]|nr:PilN domain-containing protein [Actinomycetota bacterium]